MTRKLASIRQIDEINPIPGADNIDCATIGGWFSVVKKGQFNVGDIIVYFEVDSWIPTGLAPFLSNGSVEKEFNGIQGNRLKTKKLRGVISQGLILSLEQTGLDPETVTLDEDVTERLNVQLYERPVNINLAGLARGNFPAFIPKTDQERVQNISRNLEKYKENGLTFEVTEKLDGTSCTIFRNSNLESPNGVCSRNINLKDTESSVYWNIARKYGIHTILEENGFNLAIQGEIVGHGIQGNQYGFDCHNFFVFDIYDIDNKEYFSPAERQAFCEQFGLPHVPIIDKNVELKSLTIQDILTLANGTSALNNSIREGEVYKSNQRDAFRNIASFKAISNDWLLKYE